MAESISVWSTMKKGFAVQMLARNTASLALQINRSHIVRPHERALLVHPKVASLSLFWMSSFKKRYEFKGHFTDCIISADQSSLCFPQVSEDRTDVYFRSMNDGGRRKKITTLSKPAKHSSRCPCTFSGDGTIFGLGTEYGLVKIWNAKTGGHLKNLKAHSTEILDLDATADASSFVSTGASVVKLWNMGFPEEKIREFRNPNFNYYASRLVSKDSVLLLASRARNQNEIQVWDSRDPKVCTILDLAKRTLSFMQHCTIDSFDTDRHGEIVVSFSREANRVHLWDTRRPSKPVGDIQLTLQHGWRGNMVNVSPSGRLLLIAQHYFDISSRHDPKLLGTIPLSSTSSSYRSCRFSADGEKVSVVNSARAEVYESKAHSSSPSTINYDLDIGPSGSALPLESEIYKMVMSGKPFSKQQVMKALRLEKDNAGISTAWDITCAHAAVRVIQSQRRGKSNSRGGKSEVSGRDGIDFDKRFMYTHVYSKMYDVIVHGRSHGFALPRDSDGDQHPFVHIFHHILKDARTNGLITSWNRDNIAANLKVAKDMRNTKNEVKELRFVQDDLVCRVQHIEEELKQASLPEDKKRSIASIGSAVMPIIWQVSVLMMGPVAPVAGTGSSMVLPVAESVLSFIRVLMHKDSGKKTIKDQETRPVELVMTDCMFHEAFLKNLKYRGGYCKQLARALQSFADESNIRARIRQM